jgi:hypothetical protein
VGSVTLAWGQSGPMFVGLVLPFEHTSLVLLLSFFKKEKD